LQPNPWKLHDTCGNVYEWCLDWIDAVPTGPVVDYRGTITGPYRGVRGGAWGFQADRCRSSWRLGYAPTVRFATLGFRIVLAVPPLFIAQQNKTGRSEITPARCHSVSQPITELLLDKTSSWRC
jgi:hypothetical protein